MSNSPFVCNDCTRTWIDHDDSPWLTDYEHYSANYDALTVFL
ncbi:MAG: hypothetical protein PHF42_13055 [Pseudomonas sp.]|nr:hypothetical protein [Pseudomonas sp.]